MDVGMLDVERRPDEMYLARIEVHPQYRGRGIGAHIIRGLVEEAEDHGYDLALDVLAVNHRAQALYQRLGMIEVARRGVDGIKIAMRCRRADEAPNIAGAIH